MANTLLTPKIYANTMLALLKNQLVMGKLVTTDFTDDFKQVGQTVYVKRPPEFIVTDGAIAVAQNIVQGEAPIQINQQKNVAVKLSSIEDTLTIDQLGKNAVMKSVAAQLAQTIDSAIMAKVIQFPSWGGTRGETINSVTDFSSTGSGNSSFSIGISVSLTASGFGCTNTSSRSSYSMSGGRSIPTTCAAMLGFMPDAT